MSCVRCGFGRSWHLRRGHRKCKRCGSEYVPRSKWLVSGIHLSTERWRTVIGTFLDRGTRAHLEHRAHLGEEQARSVLTVVRAALAADVPLPFAGVCEADETYVGSKWENRRAPVRRQGAKRGRGTPKQPVLGVLSREAGQVRTWVIPNPAGRTLLPRIRTQVLPGSTIYTDNYIPYRKLVLHGYQHAWVDHAQKEYVRGNVHTQGLDGFWGYMKRHLASLGGIRHDRLWLVLGEYTWRYNHRTLSHEAQVARILELLRASP